MTEAQENALLVAKFGHCVFPASPNNNANTRIGLATSDARTLLNSMSAGNAWGEFGGWKARCRSELYSDDRLVVLDFPTSRALAEAEVRWGQPFPKTWATTRGRGRIDLWFSSNTADSILATAAPIPGLHGFVKSSAWLPGSMKQGEAREWIRGRAPRETGLHRIPEHILADLKKAADVVTFLDNVTEVPPEFDRRRAASWALDRW